MKDLKLIRGFGSLAVVLGGSKGRDLHWEPIDLRCGVNSFWVLIQETRALDPFAPAVLAFSMLS